MNPFEKIHIKPQAYQWLLLGEIRPAGWMRTQMQRDLEQGFVGHLDELVPDLIRKDDIYGADRLTKSMQAKDLGVISEEKEWEAQFLWWNSETQSNWRDGLIRTTMLLEHPDYLLNIRTYIDHILATQDKDGYLGIYAPDLRYNFTSENGELWAQATLFRVLLGYYEATGEKRVLEAVLRAVDVTMQSYSPGRSHPFSVINDFAGVCHGLVFSDILDRLYQITGKEAYLDYALWLYEEFSQNRLSQDDIQYAHLADPGNRFKAHGVHTYEHLRSLLTAVYASGNPLLEKALDTCIEKLDGCLTPSGGPIGDEFIAGRSADASKTGYEYCSIQELLDSYSHLLQKTGDTRWADRLEWLLFNAGQGARHPGESAIAYLKTDNSFSMTGLLNPDDPVDERNPQIRYKYSPAHQDVAVCCVPNAGRIYPYYIRSMWMRSMQGLVCMLYGASELHTEVNGTEVHIVQETDYPFDLGLTFSIQVAQDREFDLAFRKPAWASGFRLAGETEWREADGLIILHKTWQNGDRIILRFEADAKLNSFSDGDYYFSYGPLLFALPLEGEAKEGRKYPLSGFRDLYYFPFGKPVPEFQLVEGQPIRLERGIYNQEDPWKSNLEMVCRLYDSSDLQEKPIRLVPFGGTILRRVTFSKFGHRNC